MKRFIPIILLLFIVFVSRAQTTTGITPAQTLRLARATYEQGRLHEISQQLNDGVIAKMSQQEKVEAYKILCLSYIYLEEPQEADKAMLNILLTDSYFKINEAVDPAEFVALYKTFRTNPIYRIGAKIGGNFTSPNVTERITSVSLASDSEYKQLFGIMLGAALDVPLSVGKNKRFTLHADLLYQQKRFEVTIKEDRGNSKVNVFTGTEAQSILSLPLSLEYRVTNFSFNPYISLGFSTDYLFSSKMTVQRQRPDQTSVPEKNVNLEREKINFNALAAAGVKIPLGSGFVVVEVRYTHGLNNVSSSETAYANQELALDYGYADSVFKLSSVSLAGSYVFNKFNPKKLSRKK